MSAQGQSSTINNDDPGITGISAVAKRPWKDLLQGINEKQGKPIVSAIAAWWNRHEAALGQDPTTLLIKWKSESGAWRFGKETIVLLASAGTPTDIGLDPANPTLLPRAEKRFPFPGKPPPPDWRPIPLGRAGEHMTAESIYTCLESGAPSPGRRHRSACALP